MQFSGTCWTKTQWSISMKYCTFDYVGGSLNVTCKCNMIRIGWLRMDTHLGKIYIDITIPYLPHLFSQSILQTRLLDWFVRTMTQTMWFEPVRCLLRSLNETSFRNLHSHKPYRSGSGGTFMPMCYLCWKLISINLVLWMTRWLVKNR